MELVRPLARVKTGLGSHKREPVTDQSKIIASLNFLNIHW